MLVAHRIVAVLVLAACAAGALWGGLLYWRRRGAGRSRHTFCRSPRRCSSLRSAWGCCFCPGTIGLRIGSTTSTGRSRCALCSRPGSTRRRSRGSASRGSPGDPLAAALAVRAYTTAHEASVLDMNPTVRGFLIIAADRAVIITAQPLRRARLAVPARADRVLPRDRVLHLPRLARAAERHRGVAGPSETRRSTAGRC